MKHATDRQLVVVVHGVGVKEAGVSADMLATALDEKPEDLGEATRKSMGGNRLKPHSSDDFHLRELVQYNQGGKRQLFPARIRRYRHNDDEGNLLQERVVADFYWGDVSNIASGVAGLLLAILKTILGLCHVVRENAASVFPGEGFNAWIRKLANSAVLTIHGPIAAINVILIIGILIHVALGMSVSVLGDGALAAAPWLTAAFSFIGGLALLRASGIYLTRWLSVWLVITAIVMMVNILIWPEPNDEYEKSWLMLIDQSLQQQVCNAKDMQLNSDCSKAYAGIYAHGLRLVGLMGLAWVWVVLSNAVIAILELRRKLTAPDAAPPSLVSATIALMSMLWIIMIAAVWATIVKLFATALPDKIQLQPILGTVAYAVVALFCVALAGGIVFLGNRHWGKAFNTKSYIDPKNPQTAIGHAAAHRIIMSKFMLWPIWAFLALFTYTTIAGTLHLGGWIETRAGWLTTFENSIHGQFPVIMAILAAGVGLLMAIGQQQLRAGLGIAIDVITWLNDQSWNSAAQPNGNKETRIFAERWFPALLKAGPGMKARGYWQRGRIKDRLKVMMSKLIRDEQPNQVAFVTHSQGTVVAIDTLGEDARDWLALLAAGSVMKLVTMGSPYTHVHRHYFPNSFPAIDTLSNLAPKAKKGCLTDWINVFRIDDFVGTFIDPQGVWPEEHPVPANGHTYYWVDENVFPILKKFLN